MPKITVVVATVGNKYLSDCINSILSQSLPDGDFDILLMIDGAEHKQKVLSSINSTWWPLVNVIVAPENTGKGIGGYKLYAGSAFLLKSKYIAFVDEDNELVPNHLESLYYLAEASKSDFTYSLRQIIDERGEFVVNDDCESLGKWPIWNRKDYHIDTSSYLFNREFFIDKVARPWYMNGHDADRITYNTGLRTYHHACTGLYTLKYRVRDSDGKERQDYFIRGSEFNALQTYYKTGFPWLKQTTQEIVAPNAAPEETLDLTRKL